MDEEAPQTVTIPFARRARWRWWATLVIGIAFAGYGLAVLTSPAWTNSGIFGTSPWQIWLRGEIYFVFGMLQVVVGIGYLRLTSRPAEAVVVDGNGIATRRIFGWQRLAWQDIKTVRTGRTYVLAASVRPTFCRQMLFDPRVMRIDTTIVAARAADLGPLIEHRHAHFVHAERRPIDAHTPEIVTP
ncbi:MAG: PH domain-containing protein [Pseudomonadota bacterium]